MKKSVRTRCPGNSHDLFCPESRGLRARTGFVSAVKWLTGALIGSERSSPLQQIIGMLVGAAPFLPFPLHYKNMYCRETKYHMAPCAEPVTTPAPCSAQKPLLYLGSGGRKFWKGKIVAIAAESAHLFTVCRGWSPQPRTPTPVRGAVPGGLRKRRGKAVL